jgi:hypothetical protein
VTKTTISGLTNASSYTFTVAAANTTGYGPDAAPSTAVVPNTVPGAPNGVAAAPGNASATVEWKAPSDGGSQISSFTVTTHGPGTSPAPVVVAAPATGTSIAGLTNGISYTFTVAATNAAGQGPESAPSAAIQPRSVPAPPTSVTAVPDDRSIIVSWSPSSDDGGALVTSYVVTARVLGVVLNHETVPASASTIRMTNLINGVGYLVGVAAVSAAGSSEVSGLVGPVIPSAILVAAGSTGPGYWMLGIDGRVYAFGGAAFLGEPKSELDSAQAVDIVTTPAGNGYWVLDDAGRVHPFGDAADLGGVHAATLPAGERITSLGATPSGGGYWIFTSRGRALAFGDARFHGDLVDVALNAPVVNSVATVSGDGYYMIASDGGIFAFGDAAFHGSMGGVRLNGPVEALVPDYDGSGYWLVASDGGIFAFDAPYRGSMGGAPLNKPVRGMVRFGAGYLMVGADGGIFNLSDRPFFGSLGANPPDHPIVAVSVLER